MGGGALWTNGRLLEIRNCDFKTCSAGLQAGAVFHRIEMQRDDYSVQPYAKQSRTYAADCTFTDCRADKNAGGGMESDAFDVTMERCSFTNCVATKSHGGGFNTYIAQKGSAISWGSEFATTVNVSDCQFTNCTALLDGGGFHSASNTTTVENSTFENCSARIGGAIGLNNGTNGGEQTADTGILRGVTIRNCTSTGQGGGIYANTKTLTVEDYTYKDESGAEKTVHSEISNCTAGGNGGGIAHNRTRNDQENSRTRIEGVTVSGCTSTWYGGGIYCVSRTMTVKDSAIENCVSNATTTGEGGGGIYLKGNDDTNSVGTVDHCTIRGNRAACPGGGLYTPCKLILCNDTEITGNTTEQAAEWGAGVYLEKNAALTVGTQEKHDADPKETERTTVSGNTTSSGITSNLRLPEQSNANKNCVTVLCDLGGYIGVVNAKKVGTQFGTSQNSTDGWRPSGLSDSDAVFNADNSTLHGIIDRLDATGQKIIWAGPPICKLTDGEENLLYFKNNGSDPAIFDKLDDGTTGMNRSSPFNLLRGSSTALYYADGTQYLGTDFAIKLLVENYTANSRIQLAPNRHISLTITTAGLADTDGYPYTGRRGTQATVLRGFTGNTNFIEFSASGNNNKNTSVLFTNITFDGNRDNIPSQENTRILNLNGGNAMRVTLGPSAVLQNADNSTGSNGGAGVYVYQAILTIAGGTIRGCAAPIGGAVVIESRSNKVTGFVFEAGSICARLCGRFCPISRRRTTRLSTSCSTSACVR